jgi:AcrR family transcriptional regulator
MEEKKRELILKASEVYMRYGIKSMTMDEMARQLGVSKKTLYQHVKDKNDLVEQCFIMQHEEEMKMISEVVDHTENAIEQMMKISKLIIEKLKSVHPSIFFDIAKYHPSAMKMMEGHKNEFICGSIEANLKIGIEQGLYRDNVNPEVISRIYLGMIDMIFMGDLLRDVKLRADEVYSEMFRYHIRGIASEIGLEYLVELIKNDDSLSHGM